MNKPVEGVVTKWFPERGFGFVNELDEKGMVTEKQYFCLASHRRMVTCADLMAGQRWPDLIFGHSYGRFHPQSRNPGYDVFDRSKGDKVTFLVDPIPSGKKYQTISSWEFKDTIDNTLCEWLEKGIQAEEEERQRKQVIDDEENRQRQLTKALKSFESDFSAEAIMARLQEKGEIPTRVDKPRASHIRPRDESRRPRKGNVVDVTDLYKTLATLQKEREKARG